MKFAAPPAMVWAGLKFYEQIAQRPPLHLRLFLPVPIRTEGMNSKVGDELRCIYADGVLIKRVTKTEQSRHYEFEVVQQEPKLDEGMPIYGRFLFKRVTGEDEDRRYEFEVVEQNLTFAGGLRLHGGRYTLRPQPDGCTEVSLENSYLSPKWPRWLWRPIETAIGHSFQRYILGSIRANVELRARPRHQIVRGAAHPALR